MIPILFEYDETEFITHGIGDLVDCIACECQCNDDGEYELSFSYPKNGELFGELTIGRQILAKANPWQQEQIFRIYGYGKELGGKITVNCEHISYDLNRIPVKQFQGAASDTCNAALAKVVANAQSITGLNVNRFTLYSDVEGTAQTQDGYFELSTPSSVRAAILDGDDSIKGVYGGNLVLDRYNVKLLKSGSEEGGMNRGVLVEYGVDLMDLRQEENISEMYTGVYPYYRYTLEGHDEESFAYGSIQYASGTFQNHRVMPLDVTEFFPNQAEHTAPSAAQINSKAQEWMNLEPGFGEPEINMTLSYASLGQDVRLHDQVTVRFVKMGIDRAAKVTSYKYDVLNDRVTEVQLGKTKETILFSLEDASRLKKGLLPPKRIQDKSLTADKYADGSVQSAAIGTGSVGSSKIAGGAVTTPKISSGAVTEEKVGSGAITVTKIADGAVSNPKLSDLSVSEQKLIAGAVSYYKLGSDVQVTLTDLLVASRIYATVIYAERSVSCSTIIVSGHQFVPGTIAFIDGNDNYRSFGALVSP